MDPLSILTKIPELIERAQSAYNFVKKFQHANESCSKLFGDLKTFDEALFDLESVIAVIQVSGPRPDQFRAIARFARNIQKCFETLDYICSKFDQRGPERMWNRFLWAYKDEDEIRTLQQDLEHYKSQFLVDLSLFISKDVNVIRTRQDRLDMEEKRRDLIKWLKPFDTQEKYERLSEQRQEGTCAWFTISSQFRFWRSSSGSILWLSGIPGAGKSVLTTFVINFIRTLNSKSHQETLVSFFCDFRNDASTEPITILRTLLAQLLRVYPSSFFNEIFHDLIDQAEDQNAPLSLQRLLNLLLLACSPWTRVYIVIDALDECEPDKRRQLLKTLVQLPQKNNKIFLFVSSRREHDITEIFQAVDKTTSVQKVYLSDHTQSTHADIALHVSAQIDDRQKLARLPNDIKSKIKSTLSDRAEGMFRWADCQLDVIEKVVFQSGIDHIDKTLHNLPSGLFPTYRKILEAVEHAGKDASTITRRALRWLVGATRPLSLSELVEAIMLDSNGLNEKLQVIDPRIILDHCSSLVNYHEEDKTVSVSHFSVQDFLLSNELANEKSLHQYFIPTLSLLQQELSIMIFSYLKSFRSVHVTNDRMMDALLKQHPFMQYAASSWMRHFRDIDKPDDQQKAFARFDQFLFEPAHTLLHRTCRLIHHAISPKTLEFYLEKPKLICPTTSAMEIDHVLLLLLHTGPIWVMRRLFKDHPDLLNRNYFVYGTPLMIAILNTDAEMVKTLLELGADVNRCAKHHGAEGERPPLYIAIRFRPDTHIVDMMLEHGAAVEYLPTEGDNGSIIHCAAKYGRKEILQLLIDRKVDVNTKSRDHTTPLHLAVLTGSLDMVRLLVDSGSDVNAKRISGTTPLSLALNQQSTQIIQYLIDNGAFPDGHTNLAHLAWATHQPWYQRIQTAVREASPLERSKQEVAQVLDWLIDDIGLPTLVSETILDYAEYWVTTSTTRNDCVVATENDDAPYLIAQPIKYGQEVRRIVFTTVSHDQGWGGENTGQGIYHGSNTWFEAGTSDPSRPRREIQRNVCADPMSRVHTNVWDYRDATTKPWLESLHAYDMIAVYPRAKYMGWRNHVQSVEIVVYLAHTRPPCYGDWDFISVRDDLAKPQTTQ